MTVLIGSCELKRFKRGPFVPRRPNCFFTFVLAMICSEFFSLDRLFPSCFLLKTRFLATHASSKIDFRFHDSLNGQVKPPKTRLIHEAKDDKELVKLVDLFINYP